MDKEKTKIIELLRQFKAKIQKKYDIEKIILFGSVARGIYTKESDIDLIIVGDEFKDKSVLKRSPPFYLEWDLGYPVDILCYLPSEFEEKKKQISIVREAVREGIEI